MYTALIIDGVFQGDSLRVYLTRTNIEKSTPFPYGMHFEPRETDILVSFKRSQLNSLHKKKRALRLLACPGLVYFGSSDGGIL